ncbi:MAG: 4Fe-4S binding protein [Acidobacteria bacterium]|nr:4Fe-4S binding protein [Acidobacteriota bacterium]
MWGEEDLPPTWTELIRAQSGDLLPFVAFATLVLIGFRRKSIPIKLVTLVASVLYLGVYKSQLISVVNVYGLLTWNLPILQYSLEWYLFATFTLVSTVLWGRLYCGRICAFGALTQLIDQVVPRRWRVQIPLRVERRANYIKYGILTATLGYFFATKDIAAFRYVEPFWMFTGRGTTPLWIAVSVLLVASVFVSNLYCRLLCPVGAFLGVVSNLTVFRIKRWSECKPCRICEKACEWGAIDGPRIIKSECVRCDDCERLYANEQKCPHHIILIRKADIMARRSVAPTAQAAP